MLASPNFYQNKPFIQVSSLPINQQQEFRSWLTNDSFMKLNIHNIEMDDCVHYNEYEFWFKYRFTNAMNTLEYSF